MSVLTSNSIAQPPSSALQAKAELARRELAKRKIVRFTEFTYPRYVAEPFHNAVGDAVDAVVNGDIKRLMIFAPPQHGKSELISIRLPAFWLGRHPDLPVLLTSYGGSLAFRNSRAARAVVESSEYAQVFDTRTDRNKRSVDNWYLAGHRGFCVAAGVGGPITGHGAGIGIMDDPVQSWAQAQSKTYRDSTYDWFRGTFRTRIWEGGSMVLIMTRWHEDDVAGRILADNPKDWEVLRFPALADNDLDPLGRKLDEPLAPNRFSREELESIRDDVGPQVFSAEYQGLPAPPEGIIFEVDKVNFIQEPLVEYADMVRHWDLAATEEKQGRDPDYTVGYLMGKAEKAPGIIEAMKKKKTYSKNRKFWYDAVDLVRGRWGSEQVENLVLATAKQDQDMWGRVTISIEQEPGASGKHLFEHFKRLLSDFDVQPFSPGGSKTVKSQPFAACVARGDFRVVIAPWNTPHLAEMRYFPASAHDDTIDSGSAAYSTIQDRKRWKKIPFLKIGS